MKPSIFRVPALLAVSAACAFAQSGASFTNFVRQVQLPTQVVWDMSVTADGESLSPLAIDPGGARFELWTVRSALVGAPTDYLLDTRYVGTYVPMADVVIRTEDTTSVVPRTRADRPFWVDVMISGLTDDEGAPDAAKSVNLLRHVQSYGEGGTGENLDRTQAILLLKKEFNENKTYSAMYALNSVPGANRAKVRGEERFSVFSLEDYQAPESQLASRYVQIWPVADGSIAGLEENQLIRFSLPTLTISVNDIYPNSRVYAQVYRGAPQLGVEGTVIPGSALVVNDSVPQDRVLTISDWDAVFEGEDGQWTMELLTATPFGIDRLDHVTFSVNRTIQMNGSMTTVE